MRTDSLLVAALLAFPAFAQDSGTDGTFKASWALISGDAEKSVIEQPRLTDGNDLIAALRGTFAQTDAGGIIWVLEGELRVVFGNTELTGEAGRFELNGDDELVRGRIEGRPVELAAVDSDTNERFRGSAGTITVTTTDGEGRLWVLEGNLGAALGNTGLTGEVGRFEFNGDGELIRGRIAGHPVELAAVDSDTNERFRGNAGTIAVSPTDSGGHLWVLEGDLGATLGNTGLTGAVGRFELNGEGELIRGRIAGLPELPVELSDFDADADKRYRGSADVISLDAELSTLQLLGSARLMTRKDDREWQSFEGCDLNYNWETHRSNAGTPDCKVQWSMIPVADEDGAQSQPDFP